MQSSYWTTNDEKDWLDNIGKISQSNIDSRKIDLLKNYVESSGRRQVWNNIDKFACVEHAKRLIAAMEVVE